jgi:hypothetical protein
MDVDEPVAAGEQQAAEAAAAGEGSNDAAGDTAAVDGTAKPSSKAGSAADSAADSERDSTPSAAKANGNSVAAAAAGTAAGSNGVLGGAPAAGCVVAGTPCGPPEPELLLRPFRLGPKPDALKDLWQQIQKVRQGAAGAYMAARWRVEPGGSARQLRCSRRLRQHLLAASTLIVSNMSCPCCAVCGACRRPGV